MDYLTQLMGNTSLDERFDGRKFSVYINEISSPTRFYFQYENDENSKLVEEMWKFYATNPEGYEINIDEDFSGGSMVIAYILGRWDRAVVVSSYNKPEMRNIRLFFVDWGTVEHVPKENCRKLDEFFKKIPPLAHRAGIHAIQPIGGKKLFSVDVIAQFVEIVRDKNLTVEVVKHHVKDNFYEVNLFFDGINIADVMVNQGLLEKTTGDPQCLFYPPFKVLEEDECYPTFGQRFDLMNQLKYDFNEFEENCNDPVKFQNEVSRIHFAMNTSNGGFNNF